MHIGSLLSYPKFLEETGTCSNNIMDWMAFSLFWWIRGTPHQQDGQNSTISSTTFQILTRNMLGPREIYWSYDVGHTTISIYVSGFIIFTKISMPFRLHILALIVTIGTQSYHVLLRK